MFKTKKAALEALRAAPCVLATQIGGHCYEDWEAQKATVRAKWEAQGATVTDGVFGGRESLWATIPARPGTAAHISRAAMPRVRVGKFTARPTVYSFCWVDSVGGERDSSGYVKDLRLSADQKALELETLTPGVFIRYAVGG